MSRGENNELSSGTGEWGRKEGAETKDGSTEKYRVGFQEARAPREVPLLQILPPLLKVMWP